MTSVKDASANADLDDPPSLPAALHLDDASVQSAESRKLIDAATLYAEWAALPIPRPDFLDFAHNRRLEKDNTT